MKQVALHTALWLCLAGVATAGQNVVVVLDDSGSMNERMRSQRNTTRIEAAKGALLTVLESLPPESKVGVVLLNGRGEWLLPLGEVDPLAMRSTISKIRAKGGTPLGQFMKVGTDALLDLRSKEHYGDFRLLIVTDGEAGDKRKVREYLPDILSRGITVDVIGVDMQKNHSLATKVHSYRRADDPQSLTRAVQEVFAETTGGASDAEESDFELLEGIPVEFAQAALVSLAESGDTPIGAIVGGGGSNSGNQSARPQPNQGSSRNSGGSSNPAGRRGKSFGSIFIFLIVFVALMQIVKAATRGVRR
ncbi:MAG: vWA domain-containing protein [Planctomycetota bacterium]